jgi:hypothetical protein
MKEESKVLIITTLIQTIATIFVAIINKSNENLILPVTIVFFILSVILGIIIFHKIDNYLISIVITIMIIGFISVTVIANAGKLKSQFWDLFFNKAPGKILSSHEKEWWHIGMGKYGFTYKDVHDILEYNKDSWTLPSIKDVNNITEKDNMFEMLLKDNPYWTADRATNGNPYGYCFGTQINCEGMPDEHYRDYRETDTLAIILIRKAKNNYGLRLH